MKRRLGFSQAALVCCAALALGGCVGGVSLPGELQGRWIAQVGTTSDQQAFVFRAASIEYDYVTAGGVTNSWTVDVTNAFTTASGVNIIETAGPNTFAWHVAGNTLYLDWGVPESQLQALGSDWWVTWTDVYTKY